MYHFCRGDRPGIDLAQISGAARSLLRQINACDVTKPFIDPAGSTREGHERAFVAQAAGRLSQKQHQRHIVRVSAHANRFRRTRRRRHRRDRLHARLMARGRAQGAAITVAKGVLGLRYLNGATSHARAGRLVRFCRTKKTASLRAAKSKFQSQLRPPTYAASILLLIECARCISTTSREQLACTISLRHEPDRPEPRWCARRQKWRR